MADPLSPFNTLRKSLESVFHLEAMRNGKEYTYPEVQKLKTAMDNYNPKMENSFIALLEAIKISLPHIAKWRINFASIRKSMDQLAKMHEMPALDWAALLAQLKVPPRFKVNESDNETNLNAWVKTVTKKSLHQLHHSEVAQALAQHHKDHPRFSGILNAHLEKYPDFLFQLIMDSDKNFIQICNTDLILYLTDLQIAQAIIKHIPVLVVKKSDPFEQVDQLIYRLNEILSKRPVSTLLRHAEARPVLLNSVFFQIYQSENYQKYRTQPAQQPPAEIEDLKSVL